MYRTNILSLSQPIQKNYTGGLQTQNSRIFLGSYEKLPFSKESQALKEPKTHGIPGFQAGYKTLSNIINTCSNNKLQINAGIDLIPVS